MNDTFKKLLKEKGCKVTKARVAVLEILQKQTQPSDAQTILHELTQIGVSIDQATVYRTLEKLDFKGLVKAVNFGEGKWRYELYGKHHHHLVCDNCKKVQPIEDCTADVFGEKVKQTHGFNIKRHSLEFFGTCKDCS